MAGKSSVFIDNSAPAVDDDWLNLRQNEVKNLIEAGGLTLNDGVSNQEVIAISNIISNLTYYTDSGIADAYVLSIVSPNVSPDRLRTGMVIRWRTSNSNTGASTINVVGLGLKDVKRQDGTTDPFVGEISDSKENKAVYDGTVFRLLNTNVYPAFLASMSGDQVPTSTVLTTVEFDTEAFDIGGYFNNGTYIFTPLVVGKYYVTCNLHFVSDAVFSADLNISKNGTAVKRISQASLPAGQIGFSISAILEMNGTTDTIEIEAQITSGGTIRFEADFSEFSAFKLLE